MTGLYAPKPVLAVGSLQMIFSAVILILDIVQAVQVYIVLAIVTTAAFAGVWCGIFYFITGLMGVLAGRPLPPGGSASSRRCVLTASMVMSIMNVISSFSIVIFLGVVTAAYPTRSYCRYYGHYGTSWESLICEIVPNYTVLDDGLDYLTANLALWIISMIFHLAQAILAGVNVCKSNLSTMATVTYVTTTTGVPPPVYGAGVPQAGPAPYPAYAQQQAPPYPPPQQQPYPQKI